jgi:hypothetical protein
MGTVLGEIERFMEFPVLTGSHLGAGSLHPPLLPLFFVPEKLNGEVSGDLSTIEGNASLFV